MAEKFDATFLQISSISATAGELTAVFANGNRVVLPSSDVISARQRQKADWGQARLNAMHTGIVVPCEGEEIEVSATRIRRLSNKRFDDHVARIAREQAKLVGGRLKKLRERRHLTQKAVAQLARLEPANLSRIEGGQVDVSVTTLLKILDAMDASVTDLADTHGPSLKPEREVGALART